MYSYSTGQQVIKVALEVQLKPHIVNFSPQ